MPWANRGASSLISNSFTCRSAVLDFPPPSVTFSCRVYEEFRSRSKEQLALVVMIPVVAFITKFSEPGPADNRYNHVVFRRFSYHRQPPLCAAGDTKFVKPLILKKDVTPALPCWDTHPRIGFSTSSEMTREKTQKAGLHVRRKHKQKHKHKPCVNRDDASTSTRKRSARLCLCLRRLGQHVSYACAFACACVVRVNQPWVGSDRFPWALCAAVSYLTARTSAQRYRRHLHQLLALAQSDRKPKIFISTKSPQRIMTRTSFGILPEWRHSAGNHS